MPALTFPAAATSEDLAMLLGCADRALYRIKQEGGGAAAHAREETLLTVRA